MDVIQSTVISALRDHCNYNPIGQGKGGPKYYTNIVETIFERKLLKSLSTSGLQKIFYLKMEDLVPAPPIIDKLFSTNMPF